MMNAAVFICVLFLPVSLCRYTPCNGYTVLKGYNKCGRNCYCKDNRANCYVSGEKIDIPSHITDLYINCSTIKTFDSNSLPKNVNIWYFHVQHTVINKVTNDSFVNQPFIRSFELSGCSLRDRSYTIFKPLAPLQELTEIKLKNLDIYSTSFLDFSVINKPHVTYLNFEDNMLSDLNMTFFSFFPSLQYLNLRNNHISNFSNETIITLLKHLSLEDNHFETYALDFCTENGSSLFPQLQYLNLAWNNINKLNKNHTACLDSLQELDISSNRLTVFHIASVSNLTNLKMLSLRNNWLSKIVPDRFPPALETLDLSGNQFSDAMPPKLCINTSTSEFPNVANISIKDSSIKMFWIDNWAHCLLNLTVLDFSNNQIYTCSNTSLARFLHLEELNLAGNRLKSINERVLNSSSLKRLSLQNNLIQFDIPEDRNLFKNSPNITHLDISFNAFGSLSDDNLTEIFFPLKNLTTLNINGCKFAQMPIFLLDHLKNLKDLSMNQNFLHDIHFPANFNIEIENLSINDNKIQLINEDSFPPLLRKSLKTLDLRWNDFVCDCKLRWFREQITADGKFGETQLIGWPDNYMVYCKDDGHRDTLLKDFHMTERECKPMDRLVFAFIIMGGSLFVLSVLGFFLYWNRWYIQLTWLKFKAVMFDGIRDGEREHLYSAYIISHVNDRNFVNNDFRYRMEDKLGYKLHIWDRNSRAGKVKVDEILDAMDASKAVFVIVSNDLLTWSWGIFQVDVAISRKIEDNRRNIFFVLLEDINRNNLSKSWCVMLTKMPGVPWCNEADSIKSKLFDQEVKTILGLPPVPDDCLCPSSCAANNFANDSINLEWEEHKPLLGTS